MSDRAGERILVGMCCGPGMKVDVCMVIPVYHHGRLFAERVDPLAETGLPCIVVDDGSRDDTPDILQDLARQHDWLTVITHDENQGKGGACITGCREATARGFTHVLQVDGDGQHDLADLPRFIAAAHEHPENMIMGVPQFDESIPRHRYYGRYLTHSLVWLECLSMALKDTMCGFRVYPLAALLKIVDDVKVGRRMDFDTEIAVRLYWAGVDPVDIPTRVIYHDEGQSNFRMVLDNACISRMHTRLICGMLIRSPRLLFSR